MKHALRAASLVLVAGAAVGCGGSGGDGEDGGDEPPATASTEDFCRNFDDFNAALMELGQDAENADFIKALKDAGGTFEDTGTPDDATGEERAGLQVFVQLIEDVDEDASRAELNKLEEDLSEEERQQLDAFTAYVGETCGPG